MPKGMTRDAIRAVRAIIWPDRQTPKEEYE
jgi:hypothetical protein